MADYDAEANCTYPAKQYLELYKDPRTEPSKSHTHYLEGFHTFYEKYVCGRGDSLTLLEFGGGPSVFTLISAAKHVGSITFSEYAETNRDELKLWKDEKSGRKQCGKLFCRKARVHAVGS